MIKNIVYDCGGVIIDIDPRKCLRAFAELADKQKAEQTYYSQRTLSPEDLAGDGGKSSLHDFQLGNISVEAFLDSVLPMCNPGTTRQQVIDATLSMILGLPDQRRRAILDARKKGYKVYLLSNMNDLHWPVCVDLFERPLEYEGKTIMPKVEDYFDELFLSQRMHLCKPDPRIYEELQKATGIVPEETLYIDDLQPNVDGGVAAGWKGVCDLGDGWIPMIEALPQL